MDADKVFEMLSPKLGDYYKDMLLMWLESHKTHGIFKRKTKFKIETPLYGKGYVVKDPHSCDFVIVYDKDSMMSKQFI